MHAVFASPFPLVADSLALHYRTDAGAFQRLSMTPTGAPREYVAEIPALPHGTTVDYYIVGAADSLLASLPEGAPAQTFTFHVGVDADAPVITHAPAGDAAGCQWPTTIVAEVTDNLDVGEVVLEFSIDGESQALVTMTPVGTDTYAGTFTGSASLGAAIEYRIRATDTAGIPNTSYDPSTGYHAFTLADLLVEMDVESGPRGWTHAVVTEGYVDQWHISSERNTTPGGSSSWKFGDTGSGGYAIMADGALVMPPVTLGAGATMTFSDSLDAWPWNSSIAADGAVVELSTDGGSSWELIEPVGGYSHQSGGFTPFPPDYTCWSGWHDWREETFLLDAFAGETVTIRFRFASWGYGVYDGWYVDDVVLTPNCTLVDVEPDVAVRTTALRGLSPNPFNPVTTIRYELAEDAQVSLRVFDAAGRRVRTLVDRAQSPGHYRLRWDGNGDAGARVASGVYWLRMTTSSGHRETTKMVLLK